MLRLTRKLWLTLISEVQVTYRAFMFLIYVGFMVRALIVSRKKWGTLGAMSVTWFLAIGLAVEYGSATHNGAAAWERWGLATFIVPAIVGSLHTRSTQPPPLESEIR